jgi:hypothetical protein
MAREYRATEFTINSKAVARTTGSVRTLPIPMRIHRDSKQRHTRTTAAVHPLLPLLQAASTLYFHSTTPRDRDLPPLHGTKHSLSNTTHTVRKNVAQ